MKCYVCGTDNIENKARCPLCGFPVPRIVGDGDQEIEKLKEIAEKYRRKKMEGLKVGMVIYNHEKDEENLKLNLEESLCLADCVDLQIGKTLWCDQDFARVDTRQPIELKVWVQKLQESVHYYIVKTQAPDSAGFWHVGVRMLDGWRLQLVLKDDEKATESEAISLEELV